MAQARRRRVEAELEEEQERAAQRAEELQQELKADAERRQQEQELFQKARRRAMSDATEMPPPSEDLTDLTPIETFQEEIQWQGASFMSVKLFHPRKGVYCSHHSSSCRDADNRVECLGIVWQADPVTEDPHASFNLEVLSITFESRYYSTSQGRKKLKALEAEIQRLCSIRHNNLLAILAVKFTTSHSSGPARLALLCEGRPSVTLEDVLQDSDSLREDRATVRTMFCFPTIIV